MKSGKLGEFQLCQNQSNCSWGWGSPCVALTLPWLCLELSLTLLGLASTLPWSSFDIALTLLWPYIGLYFTLPWLCLDLALNLHWPCLDLALTLPWCCLYLALTLNWHGAEFTCFTQSSEMNGLQSDFWIRKICLTFSDELQQPNIRFNSELTAFSDVTVLLSLTMFLHQVFDRILRRNF